VLREHLATFLARARNSDRALPRFVERELRAYLGCGILAHGLVRVHGSECGFDRVVAFSCARGGASVHPAVVGVWPIPLRI